MKILLQGVEILDSRSPHHLKEKNVLINNGVIAEIGDKNYSADKVIRGNGMKLSIGWCDLGTFVGDPGLEHKETIQSVTAAAMAGGFTELATLPNTHPAVQTKNEVTYLLSGNRDRLVQIRPLASVTVNNEGTDLTEMIDLNHAGAAGFTDGLKTIWNTDILHKSLQYVQKFGGIVIDHPEDIWLGKFGQMHEGVASTRLGLKGIPRIAEDVAVSRNLELLNYSGGRLHFARISSAKSIELIRAAKRKLAVTCDVTTYQALLDDQQLNSFDTNYKVNPPLREKSDMDAIIKALRDGTIDILCSGHLPQDPESKDIEFDHADFGMIALQTVASNLEALSKQVELALLMDKLTINPRVLLGLPLPVIEKDVIANLTLFDPNAEWVLDETTNYSTCKNSPWYGKKLTGKVRAVFNNGHFWIDPSI